MGLVDLYSGLTLNQYGVANALMYYPYTAGVVTLSHFYFNPLYLLGWRTAAKKTHLV